MEWMRIVFSLAWLGTLVLTSGNRNQATSGSELSFDCSAVELELPMDVQKGKAVFRFTNVGPRPVTIREIRTECDCVQGSVKLGAVEPGDSGQLTLGFHARVRNGRETIRAEVITENGNTYPVFVAVKLHSLIETTPQVLRWSGGEPREAKEFAISSTGTEELRFTKAISVTGTKIEVLDGGEPQSMRVRVIPPNGDGKFQDSLLVTAVLVRTGEARVYSLPIVGT
jgi:hypothetical protein